MPHFSDMMEIESDSSPTQWIDEFITFNRNVLGEPGAEVVDMKHLMTCLKRLTLPYLPVSSARQTIGAMHVAGMPPEYSTFEMTAYMDRTGQQVLYAIHTDTCMRRNCQSKCIHNFLSYKGTK